jgi:hypothetical protein
MEIVTMKTDNYTPFEKQRLGETPKNRTQMEP